MIDNYFIAEQFSLLAKLMDMHGENSFRSRTYSSAAFAIEKVTLPLADMPEEKLVSIKGGAGIGSRAEGIFAMHIHQLGQQRKLFGYEVVVDHDSNK